MTFQRTLIAPKFPSKGVAMSHTPLPSAPRKVHLWCIFFGYWLWIVPYLLSYTLVRTLHHGQFELTFNRPAKNVKGITFWKRGNCYHILWELCIVLWIGMSMIITIIILLITNLGSVCHSLFRISIISIGFCKKEITGSLEVTTFSADGFFRGGITTFRIC